MLFFIIKSASIWKTWHTVIHVVSVPAQNSSQKCQGVMICNGKCVVYSPSQDDTSPKAHRFNSYWCWQYRVCLCCLRTLGTVSVIKTFDITSLKWTWCKKNQHVCLTRSFFSYRVKVKSPAGQQNSGKSGPKWLAALHMMDMMTKWSTASIKYRYLGSTH